jgi:7-carboxy-7-deazaguanine synthase
VKEREMSADEILSAIRAHNCTFVEFTGGEPLEQPDVLPLMMQLCNEGYTVAVETGGHIDLSPVDQRVIRILDVKCPDSRMMTLNNYDNLNHLQPHDEVKFVIASRTDFEWARDFVRQHDLATRTSAVLFSPAFGLLPYVDLVNWILEDHLPVRFQAQLHKHIWSPDTRGV